VLAPAATAAVGDGAGPPALSPLVTAAADLADDVATGVGRLAALLATVGRPAHLSDQLAPQRRRDRRREYGVDHAPPAHAARRRLRLRAAHPRGVRPTGVEPADWLPGLPPRVRGVLWGADGAAPSSDNSRTGRAAADLWPTAAQAGGDECRVGLEGPNALDGRCPAQDAGAIRLGNWRR
jgi:hypothetical protein